MYLSSLLAGAKQVRHFFLFVGKKHNFLRWNILSTGYGNSHEKGSVLFYFKKVLQVQGKDKPHQFFPVKKPQSPSSLTIMKLCCLQSRAQKKGSPVLVSTMSQMFSKENNSLSWVEIQCKIYLLYGDPVMLNPETYTWESWRDVHDAEVYEVIHYCSILFGFLYLKHLTW